MVIVCIVCTSAVIYVCHYWLHICSDVDVVIAVIVTVVAGVAAVAVVVVAILLLVTLCRFFFSAN